MSKALFVFDHKYPCDQHGEYYYSSGFDKEFFSRYYEIFDEITIFGRRELISDAAAKGKKKIEYPCEIITFDSNKKLFKDGASRSLMNAIDSSDCVISRMPSIFGALAIRYAKKIKKPYIVEIVACTYDALSSSSSWKRRALAVPVEAFYRHVLRNNPYSVYVTEEFLQRKYPCYGKQIPCSNVTLLDVDENALQSRIARIESMDMNEIVIGTTSTLGVDFKGQQYVIQAIKKLNERGIKVKYQMVGDGDGEWLLKIAKREGVFEQVQIIGSLPHSAVFEWLDTLDVYVHPSCQEGLSRAIIEAMSRGCPIVAADTGGIHELIDDEYIVPKKDVMALVGGISDIMDKDVLAEQAKKNHQKAKSYLKKTLYARRISFYNEFLNESGVAIKTGVQESEKGVK